MATFTTFDAPANLAIGTGGRRATADDFGGSAKGLMTAAAELKKAGTILTAKEEAHSKAAVDQSYMDGRSYWVEELQRRQDAAPEGAAGFTNTFKQDFDTYVQGQLGAEHLTKTSKAYMKTKFEGLRGTFIGQSVGFESKSSAKMRRNVVERGLDDSTNIAYADIQMYSEGLQSGLELIEGSNVTDDVKAGITKDFRSNLAHKTLLGELNRDPEWVLSALEADYWKGELTDTAFAQISEGARSKLAVMDAKAITAQNKANAAAFSAVNSVASKYEDGFTPTPDELADMNSKLKASDNPDIKKRASDLQAFSGRLNEMKGMHTTELRSFMDLMPAPGAAVTDLQQMTIRAGNLLLGRKEAADTTLLGDLTAEMKRVRESGGVISTTTAVLAQELVRTSTDRSTATLAAAEITAAQATGALKGTDMSQAAVNAALSGVIQAADADGNRTVSEAAQVDTVRKFADNMNKVLSDEGALSWYNGRSDTVIAPVNIKDVGSLTERFTTARSLQEKSGAAKYQFFLPHELSAMHDEMKEMTAPERVSFYRSMQLAGGPDAKRAFQEISDKGAPRMGYVAGMANHPNPRFGVLSAEIEQGALILEGPDGANRRPPNDQMKKAFEREVGEAIGPLAPEGTRAAMFEAATALFVARGLATTGGLINQSQATDVIKEVIGGSVVKFNGAKTMMPIGVDGDTFEAAIRGMTAQDIADATSRTGIDDAGFVAPQLKDKFGEPVSASAIADRGMFEYVGPNKYRVRKIDQPEYVMGANGRPAVFDLTAPLNKQRTP